MNDPVLYARSNPFQSRDAKSALCAYEEQLIHTEDTDNVLDIGCGSGNVTRNILAPFCQRYRHIVGVDISPDMIGFARQQNSDSKNIFFQVLDISEDVENFKRCWGGFSKVFSFYCLHWIKDLGTALKNISTLMNYGGECLLVFVAQCPVFDMYEKMSSDSRWADYMTDADNFVPMTQHSPQPVFFFSQLMNKAGLKVKNCEVVEKDFVFPTVALLKDCMCAVNPFIKRIPPNQRNEYIMDCLKTLASLRVPGPNMQAQNLNNNANSNGHRFSYKLMIAQGRKL